MKNETKVYNIVGKAVMSLFPSSDSTTVDIAHLANGIYIAEILTASGKGNVKLLKEKTRLAQSIQLECLRAHFNDQ